MVSVIGLVEMGSLGSFWGVEGGWEGEEVDEGDGEGGIRGGGET